MNVTLSIDLVVPEEALFRLDSKQLSKLEMEMFQQSQREAYALTAEQCGAFYMLRFQEQFNLIVALRRFTQANPSYSALADGYRLYSWIHAYSQPINYGSLISAWRSIIALDEIVPAIPPTITEQPADQAVLAGEPAVFTVSVSGTTPFEYQWAKSGQPILGATLARYVTPAISDGNYSVVVSNAAGSVTSTEAKLRTIRKEFTKQ